VRGLVEAGYSEIVLTGINLSAYGSDRSENLLSLTRTLHDIEGLKRIRLSSIEPRVLQKDFVREMAGLEKVCPHFHLSLQSGCTRTLERMNRKYTTREFSEAAFCLREAFFRERGAYPALTADIIVGFPGESEEDFEECRSFLEDFGFFETHVFRYSRRRGTAAARMDGQIPEDIKARRSRILIELGKKNREAFIRELMSNTSYTPELLVEEQIEVEGETYQAGHTGEYVLAAVKSETDLSGKLVRGRISRIVPMAGERSICIIDDFDV
jgi:threonylcarbamoyladenosine tRNA methylthiotransferase MtaB